MTSVFSWFLSMLSMICWSLSTLGSCLIAEYHSLSCSCSEYDSYPGVYTAIDILPVDQSFDIYASSEFSPRNKRFLHSRIGYCTET